VSKALEEKQRLIADILHIPIDDFDNIVDIASQPSPDRDAREVLLAALAQGESTILAIAQIQILKTNCIQRRDKIF